MRQTGAQAIICPNCHSPNHASQRFCSTCGQAFGAPRGGQPVSAHITAMPQTSAPPGALVNCPECHAPNRQVNRFCTRCGANMLRGVVGRKCFKCGSQSNPGARFCTTCGANLA